VADRKGYVAEQFDTLEQQSEASTLGMWVFIVTEMLFFGGLFTAYTVYRSSYPAAFGVGSRHLDMWLGGLNTAVLLVSSCAMALAVHAARHGNRRATALLLLTTALLGTAFLCIKGLEYYQDYQKHLVPGSGFSIAEVPSENIEMFFVLYFVMTGLHGLHVLIGVCIMTVLMILTLRNRYSAEYFQPVEVAGLYWHFVDIVWIFLYPLLYLIDLNR
jgi:cytochrome c oxidase subunit 3